MTVLTKDSEQQDISTVLGKPNSWTRFRSSQEFSLHIEMLASETGMTCIETILEFCTAHGLEPKDISSKVNKSLRDKLAEEYGKINYLPKGGSLL